MIRLIQRKLWSLALVLALVVMGAAGAKDPTNETTHTHAEEPAWLPLEGELLPDGGRLVLIDGKPYVAHVEAGSDSPLVEEVVPSESRTLTAQEVREMIARETGLPVIDFERTNPVPGELIPQPGPSSTTPSPSGGDVGAQAITASSTYPARTMNYYSNFDRKADGSWSSTYYKIGSGMEAGTFTVNTINNKADVPGNDDSLLFKISTAASFRQQNFPALTRVDDTTAWAARGSNLNLGDDTGAWVSVNTKFLGTYYNWVYICANGYVKLADDKSKADWTAVCSTSGELNTNTHKGSILAPFFRDLNPAAGGQVRYSLEGHYAYIQWDNVPFYGDSTKRATFEIILDRTLSCSSCGFEGLGETEVMFRYKSVPEVRTPFIVDQFHQKLSLSTGAAAVNKRDDLRMKVTSTTIPSPYTKVTQAQLRFFAPTGQTVDILSDATNGPYITGMNLDYVSTHESHLEPHHDTGSLGSIATVVGIGATMAGCATSGGGLCVVGLLAGATGLVVSETDAAKYNKLYEFARHATVAIQDSKTGSETQGAMVGNPRHGYPFGIRDTNFGPNDVMMAGLVDWHLTTASWSANREIEFRPWFQVRSLYLTSTGTFSWTTWNVAPSSGMKMTLTPPNAPSSCFSFTGAISGSPNVYVVNTQNTADASCSSTGNSLLPGHTQLRHKWAWGDGTGIGYGSDDQYRVHTKSYSLPGGYTIRHDGMNAWGREAFSTRAITVT